MTPRPRAPIVPPDSASRDGSVGPGPTARAGARADAVLTRGRFWLLFSAGWLTYAGLATVTLVLEGETLGRSLIGAVGIVIPLALPAAVLARYRKWLLRPRATVARYVGHKLVIGVLYAATVCSVGSLLMAFTPIGLIREYYGATPVALLAWLLSGLFLYGIFLVCLMWLDALERVQVTRALAAEEAVLRARAEAKAVRAQFNPHFVFNTLHSLMLLVRREPDAAERAIEDVAELIRYASILQRREVDQVPLSKELAFAERYLALEKLRLADRLRVSRDMQEGLDDVLVPALSLQTLLENAINHGIAPKPEGGCIRITARAGDGVVVMEISDDGVGADPADVADADGSGLALLRARLTNVHGPAADLSWETAPGEGFKARLTLPDRRVRPGPETRVSHRALST